ncbi:unnamed protein product [Durusdinium trenchii]|uniref:Uncharacterized protein n=2 Tax=Durusdinium trenchii TaxID=1381693 RepID=A0ABP0NWB9_9DINO
MRCWILRRTWWTFIAMWGRANVGILALWLGRGRVNIALGEKEEPQIWRFGWSVDILQDPGEPDPENQEDNKENEPPQDGEETIEPENGGQSSFAPAGGGVPADSSHESPEATGEEVREDNPEALQQPEARAVVKTWAAQPRPPGDGDEEHIQNVMKLACEGRVEALRPEMSPDTELRHGAVDGEVRPGTSGTEEMEPSRTKGHLLKGSVEVFMVKDNSWSTEELVGASFAARGVRRSGARKSHQASPTWADPSVAMVGADTDPARPSPLRRAGTVARQLLAAPVASDDVDLDEVAYGFMASQALFCALELGIFDHLASAGKMKVEDLSKVLKIPPTRLQTLLTALTAAKCLRLTSGSYSNSPNVSKFMVSSSKAFYGDYLKYQIGRLFYARMGQLLPVLKGEETLNYSGWFSDPEVAASYTMAQHNGSLATAKALFRRVSLDHVQRMLDVGGGSGAFSVTAVQRVPSLFATVLELPAVCAEGRRLTAAAGPAAARVEFRALDATEPTRWPVEEASQDLVLMSYLCGSIPEEALLPLYRNAFGALRPGGRLVVHDFMVEDSKDGPALGAYWALQHVTVNPQGLGLTPSGVAERLAAAGFEVLEQSDLIARMTKVVVGRKPE